MKTTIDQHRGIHSATGLVIRELYDVITDESAYPDRATAEDAHAARVELQSLPQARRREAIDLLAAEDCDHENEASVIRRCIQESADNVD